MSGEPRPGNRIFVALDLPAPVREGLGATALALARDFGGRAVPAENLHLTLHFLGRVPVERVPRLADVLHAACATAAPLRMRLGALAGRPGRGRARLLAQELEGGGEALDALHRALGAGLAAALDLPPADGRLWPHVTLVRFARPVRIPAGRLPEGVGRGDERAFDVSRAALYDSVQSAGRPPRYDALVSAALGIPSTP
jgi:2'-5' RNA ligase